MDVCMPELDGFELAAMIRDHPRFRKTAIIFISAIHLTDMDRLRGYEMGAVDYVPVPVIPEVLRAKVKIFAELYRKSRQLGAAQCRTRAAGRGANRGTGALDQTPAAKRGSPQPRTCGRQDGVLGLGSCAWRLRLGRGAEAYIRRRSGVLRGDALDRSSSWFIVTIGRFVRQGIKQARQDAGSYQVEFRICRPDGGVTMVPRHGCGEQGCGQQVSRISGVTIDITDRKEAEERQVAARPRGRSSRQECARGGARDRLADPGRQHRAVRRRRRGPHSGAGAGAQPAFRIPAGGVPISPMLIQRGARAVPARRISTGSGFREASLSLEPSTAQALALALHELATNAAKYGALVSAVRPRSRSFGK